MSSSDPVTEVRSAVTADPYVFRAADLVWHNSATSQVAYWQVDGSTLFNGIDAAIPGDPWKLKVTGDFNKDGATDFAWQNRTTDEIAVWLLDPTDRSQQRVMDARVIGTPVGWDLAAGGDLNTDGSDDLLFRNRTDGSNAVWQMNGFSFTGSYLPPVGDLSWHLKGVSDLDGNGSPEIVWRNDNGSNVAWVMKPEARLEILGSWSIQSVGAEWELSAVTDINSDGKSDLLWRGPGGATAFWLMDGASIAGSDYIQPPVADGNWKLVGTRIPGGDASPARCADVEASGVGSCSTRDCGTGVLAPWAWPTIQGAGSCQCVCDDDGAIDKSKGDKPKKDQNTPCTLGAARELWTTE